MGQLISISSNVWDSEKWVLQNPGGFSNRTCTFAKLNILAPLNHSQTAGSWSCARFESFKCRLKIDFVI